MAHTPLTPPPFAFDYRQTNLQEQKLAMASPKKDKKDTSKAAEELLAAADRILKEVDDAEIFRSNVSREHPIFTNSGM